MIAYELVECGEGGKREIDEAPQSRINWLIHGISAKKRDNAIDDGGHNVILFYAAFIDADRLAVKRTAVLAPHQEKVHVGGHRGITTELPSLLCGENKPP
jgi:hypothetical protein